MEVYVEYVIIDNIFISYLIGRVCYIVLHLNKSKRRLFVASVVGTIIALLYPFIESTVLLLLVKVLSMIITALLLFWKRTRLFIGCLVLLAVTFAFGGILLAVNYMLVGKITDVSHDVYDFPIGVIIGLAYGIKWLISFAYRRISGAVMVRKNVYEFVVGYNGKEMRLRGFIDTGNRLTYGQDLSPVVIVKAIKIMDILDAGEFYDFINDGKGEYITLTTVAGGSKRLMVIKPEKFELVTSRGRENKEVVLAVSFAPITDSDDYDAILHPLII